MNKKHIGIYLFLTIMIVFSLTGCLKKEDSDYEDSTNMATVNEDSNSGQDNEQSEIMPWEDGGKDPAEYTYSEYLQLTDTQKNAFISWFDNQESFDEWLDSVYPKDSTPTDLSGPKSSESSPFAADKDIDEYTWMEFQEFTTEQRDAFAKSFDNNDEFQSWLDKKYEEFLKDEQ